MRKSNYPTAMTYAEMEHAIYMRRRERQADRLVKTLQALTAGVIFGIVIGIAAVITSML